MGGQVVLVVNLNFPERITVVYHLNGEFEPVIRSVSYLFKVGGSPRVLHLSSPVKLTAQI